jgi:hypothetical protein
MTVGKTERSIGWAKEKKSGKKRKKKTKIFKFFILKTKGKLGQKLSKRQVRLK